MKYFKTLIILVVLYMMTMESKLFAEYQFNPIDLPEEIADLTEFTSISSNGQHVAGTVLEENDYLIRYTIDGALNTFKNSGTYSEALDINDSGQLLGSYEPIRTDESYPTGCRVSLFEPDNSERELRFDGRGSCNATGVIKNNGSGVFGASFGFNPVSITRFSSSETDVLYKARKSSDSLHGLHMSSDGTIAGVERGYRARGKRKFKSYTRLYRSLPDGTARRIRNGRGLRRAKRISLIHIDDSNTAYYLVDISRRRSRTAKYQIVTSSSVKFKAERRSAKFEGYYYSGPVPKGVSGNGDILVEYTIQRNATGNILEGPALINLDRETPQFLSCLISNSSDYHQFFGNDIATDGTIVGSAIHKDGMIATNVGVFKPLETTTTTPDSFCIGSVTVAVDPNCDNLSLSRREESDFDSRFELFDAISKNGETCDLIVTMTDAEGNPIVGADVEFQKLRDNTVLTSGTSDSNGVAKITFPLGNPSNDSNSPYAKFDQDYVLRAPANHPTIREYIMYFDEID